MGIGGRKRVASAWIVGALAADAVQAGGLHVLSDEEMSQVRGFGLSAPTLQTLTRQDQSASYASADGAFAALTHLTAEGTATLERQTASQQMAAATVGLQQTIRLAQTLSATARLTTPVPGVGLPGLSFPGFGLPLPLPPVPGGSDGKKH